MKAIYAGSFDPFTNGHLDIVSEAAKIFDEVIVVCARNSKKIPYFNRNRMYYAIEKSLADCGIDNSSVILSDGLISHIAHAHGVDYLVRGLRNTADFMYEEELAKFNNRLNPKLRTIYIRTVDETLSSSAVRELLLHGKDVSGLVPRPVFDIIQD